GQRPGVQDRRRRRPAHPGGSGAFAVLAGGRPHPGPVRLPQPLQRRGDRRGPAWRAPAAQARRGGNAGRRHPAAGDRRRLRPPPGRERRFPAGQRGRWRAPGRPPAGHGLAGRDRADGAGEHRAWRGHPHLGAGGRAAGPAGALRARGRTAPQRGPAPDRGDRLLVRAGRGTGEERGGGAGGVAAGRACRGRPVHDPGAGVRGHGRVHRTGHQQRRGGPDVPGGDGGRGCGRRRADALRHRHDDGRLGRLHHADRLPDQPDGVRPRRLPVHRLRALRPAAVGGGRRRGPDRDPGLLAVLVAVQGRFVARMPYTNPMQQHRGPRAVTPDPKMLSHLDRLEAESIHILREVAAEFRNPVMMYSVGKDSSVLLHLLVKAFFPARPPIPMLHVDTKWKFREMIAFRDRRAAETGVELRTWTNPEGLAQGIGPVSHGATVHTDVMKTQALKQALDHWQFDAAIGGARRDEEKSRAKERIFSFRNAQHRWDPKNQRPELWDLYNARIHKGESVRVFPISNWTELDVWLYIYRENIPVPSLYFAAERPVVERDGALIMVDDERL